MPLLECLFMLIFGHALADFVLQPAIGDVDANATFAEVFEIETGHKGFDEMADDTVRAAMVKIRTANTWRSKWIRTSPYYIRVSGEWIICTWAPLAPTLRLGPKDRGGNRLGWNL